MVLLVLELTSQLHLIQMKNGSLFLQLSLKYVETPLPETLDIHLFISHLYKLGHILTRKSPSKDQVEHFEVNLLYAFPKGEEAMPK